MRKYSWPESSVMSSGSTRSAFDAGFKTALLAKDVTLYRDNARAAGAPHDLGEVVAALWQACDHALPGSDFTRVYEYLREGRTV